ncbi:unnamed protein product [Phytophthora fragariaefolia]|uniref:Unnamed protein product n=1 Tax=Phytophthora fragariaefolia TaxID=1490495 RepID=A0A9W6U7W2_9STRA|nr:unnamed protein product [Phytophthora fragariaefolia]
MHFQRLSQQRDDLKTLQPELLKAITALGREQEQEASHVASQRIPRPAEIASRRRQRSVGEAREKPQKRQVTPSEQVQGKEAAVTMQVDATPQPRADLTADDFKAMLETAAPREEQLTTKAIRQRLGLLYRAGAQASASETAAREEQEAIQSDMMSLARQLKDRTQTINQSLAEDAKILDAVGQSAESNTALLDRENAKLKEQLASSIGLWTSLWLVAMLVIVFVVTYFYMKLFSRRW